MIACRFSLLTVLRFGHVHWFWHGATHSPTQFLCKTLTPPNCLHLDAFSIYPHCVCRLHLRVVPFVCVYAVSKIPICDSRPLFLTLVHPIYSQRILWLLLWKQYIRSADQIMIFPYAPTCIMNHGSHRILLNIVFLHEFLIVELRNVHLLYSDMYYVPYSRYIDSHIYIYNIYII